MKIMKRGEAMSETKNEIMIVDEQSLRNKIYTIRGQQVAGF